MGSPADTYLQLAVAQERRCELLRLRALIYASWAAISPELAKQAIEASTEALNELQGVWFPGTEAESKIKRQKREETMLDGIFQEMGYGHLVPGRKKPVASIKESETPERDSIWEQMGK